MRLHRLLGIIMLLDSRGTMKAGNLAKILETSERSIYRDIDILCEAGIPIMSTPGPNGGYSFMEDYKITSNMLGKNDALNLLFSSMGIMPEKNTETSQQLTNALIKLEKSVSEEHRQEILKAKERFFVDSDPWWGKRIENKHIDVIKESVLKLKKLKITYRKYTGEVSVRILHPYGVVVKNTEWYVAAFCESKSEVRTFKCSRLQDIEVLDESFTMPPNFSLDEYWGNSKKQFVRHASSRIESKSYPVKIKFYGEKGNLLEGFTVHSSIIDNNIWIYEIEMLSFETACSMIFPLSDKIEVLEPMELKEYIISKSMNILALYRK